MTNDPDQIRAEIERTRENLSSNVNALADEVNPKNIAHRQVDKVSSVGDAASGAPSQVRAKAQGNPLAAGVIAFGVGWLVSSLLPATAKEREAAEQLKQAAQPIAQEAQSLAKEVAGNLKEPAQEAVQSVKGTATDAAQTVKQEGTSAAQDVKTDAQSAKDNVQESRQS